MIGCLRTRVRNQPIIALYFESENVLKLYNLEARCSFAKSVSDKTRADPEIFVRGWCPSPLSKNSDIFCFLVLNLLLQIFIQRETFSRDGGPSFLRGMGGPNAYSYRNL